MKVRASVKKICKKCKVIRRAGRRARAVQELRATSSGRARGDGDMARIAGVDLPRNKRMEIALTYIYGIGRSAARKILRRGARSIRHEDRRSDRRRGRTASAR